MPRTKSFDQDAALQAAITTFAEHGYEGTSAQMLTRAMGIGRQSIYDTFGDKWQLYVAALREYTRQSVSDQIAVVRHPARAIDGIKAHLLAFADAAFRSPACLGLSSVSEFGCGRAEISEISHKANALLTSELASRITQAQRAGDVASDLDPVETARFLVGNLSAIKLAARGGASSDALHAMVSIALRALR
jgi:TetR/AcrR family transcriptional regulator, transcriptional repressor for nem operon